jgi:hypothetical protein
MGSMAMRAGGVLLAAETLIAAPAGASAAAPRVVRVPCGAGALASAITPAGGVLRLAPHCVYDITTPATAATGLPVITGSVTLVGGPATTIRRAPAAAGAFRILDVAAGGDLRVVGIAILNGATPGLGGGVQNAGRLVLSHTTLSGDRALDGGAVANLAGATAVISRSVITGNAATSVGGGILNSGTLTVFAGVLEANTAPVDGGALNTQATGMSRLIGTTVEHNTAGGRGGGMSNLGTTRLDGSVVRFNRGSSGGGIATGTTRVLLSRSLVRDNMPDDCSPAGAVRDCPG